MKKSRYLKYGELVFIEHTGKYHGWHSTRGEFCVEPRIVGQVFAPVYAAMIRDEWRDPIQANDAACSIALSSRIYSGKLGSDGIALYQPARVEATAAIQPA